MARISFQRDRNRAKLERRKRLQIAREERPESRMGDLHLREDQIKGRGSQKFRKSVKRQSNRLRRRRGRAIARRYM